MNFLFHFEKQFTFNHLHLTANRYMNVNSKFFSFQVLCAYMRMNFTCSTDGFFITLYKFRMHSNEIVKKNSYDFQMLCPYNRFVFMLLNFTVEFFIAWYHFQFHSKRFAKNIFCHFLDAVTIQSKAVCIRICIQTASF